MFTAITSGIMLALLTRQVEGRWWVAFLVSVPVLLASLPLFKPDLRIFAAVLLVLWSIMATFSTLGPFYWVGAILMFFPERRSPDNGSD